MPTSLPFEPLDPLSLSPARLRLWTLWQEHSGRPELMDKVSDDQTFTSNCLFFRYLGGDDLHASFIGRAVRAREAEANAIPDSIMEVYPEPHRPFVANLFTEMAAAACGSEGYVERRMKPGQTPVRTRFLCLPVLEKGAPVTRFISVDSGVTYKSAADIPDEATLPTGYTRLTHITLVALS